MFCLGLTFKREISFRDSSRIAPTYSKATERGTVFRECPSPANIALLNWPVPSPARIRAILTGGRTPCRRASSKASWISLNISAVSSSASSLPSVSFSFALRYNTVRITIIVINSKTQNFYTQEKIPFLPTTYILKPFRDHAHELSKNVGKDFRITLAHGQHLPTCLF